MSNPNLLKTVPNRRNCQPRKFRRTVSTTKIVNLESVNLEKISINFALVFDIHRVKNMYFFKKFSQSFAPKSREDVDMT